MRLFFPLAFAAGALMTLSQASFAQDGPRTLTPRILAPVEQTQPPATQPALPSPKTGGINITSLNEVSSEALGVLTGKHALPVDMWHGSQRNLIDPLINALPASPAQPYLSVLQRRLLLSAAKPPVGQASDKSLLALRVEKLAEMGHDKDLLNLVANTPQNDLSPPLLKAQSQAFLYQGDIAQACRIGAANLGTNDDPYWVKLMTFCRMLAQQVDQARLSLSLLRDMGDNDPAYFALMNALAEGKKAKLEELNSLSALTSALIRQTQTPLPQSTKASDDVRLTIMVAKTGALTSSFKASERNMFGLASLAKNLKATSFDADALDSALDVAPTLPAPKAQALLYQVVRKENQLNVIKTEAMALALEIAAQNQQTFSISRLYQPQIANLSQSIDLLWFAPVAFRTQLNAGNWGNAKEWYLMLRNAAFTDPQAAQSFAAVRPLAVLAGFDVAKESVHQALDNWWQAQSDSALKFEKAARLYSMIDGLGQSVPDVRWLDVMNGPALVENSTPKPGLWIKLNKAALAGRTGEVVALSLNAIGYNAPAKMDPTFLRDLLFAYRAVGLENEARIIAVETALRAGL